MPTVLLGLRSVFKPDFQASVAEMVYDVFFKLPGDFFSQSSRRGESNPSQFVLDLKEKINLVRPVETSHRTAKNTFIMVILKCAQE